jgi:predicted acyltransferase
MLKILTGVLFFYWGLLWIGGSSNPYDPETNLVRRIDMLLLGEQHLYFSSILNIYFDPEGLLSTLPSVGTIIIGYLMGGMIHTTKNYHDCVRRMAIFGIAITFIGYIWGFIFPINKALWTSSYVLFTGGIATIVLSVLTYAIDIKKWKGALWVFEVFGTNSIFLFILSGVWTKTIIKINRDLDGVSVNAYHYLYKTVFVPIGGDLNGSFLFAISHVMGFWLILLWMHRKDIKIKL